MSPTWSAPSYTTEGITQATSQTLIEPALSNFVFNCDTSIENLTLMLWAAVNNFGRYTFCNTGTHTVTLIPAGTDTIANQSSLIISPGQSFILSPYETGKWNIIMAYEPGAATGSLPNVAITATETLGMPASDTRYICNPTAATTVTLPTPTGSGRRLEFEFQNLGGFAFTFSLPAGVSYDTPLPAIVAGANFALLDIAANVWGIG